MELHIHGFPKHVLIIFCIAVILNLLIVDVWLIGGLGRMKAQNQKPLVAAITTTPSVSIQKCPLSCLDVINEATASVKITPSAIKTATNTETTNANVPQTKEFYFPLGSGSSTANDWTDVPGLQIYVDTSKYAKIKSAYFEASVNVPNTVEDVYVRLVNATDQRPVWFSDLFFPSGTTTTYLVSPAITLDSGNKLYKLQMKTQLKAPAFLNQARIHIITD